MSEFPLARDDGVGLELHFCRYTPLVVHCSDILVLTLDEGEVRVAPELPLNRRKGYGTRQG